MKKTQLSNNFENRVVLSWRTRLYALLFAIFAKKVHSCTRASKENLVMESAGGQILMTTFISDAARLWNLAPKLIKNSTSLYLAKRNIKEFSLTLPI